VAEILMSDEVREALGVEGARQVVLTSLEGGHCPVCHDGLPAGGPANVVVVRSSTITHAAYAHPGCSGSVVLDVPHETLVDEWPQELDMQMTAVMI
jgi:hypothetical protein